MKQMFTSLASSSQKKELSYSRIRASSLRAERVNTNPKVFGRRFIHLSAIFYKSNYTPFLEFCKKSLKTNENKMGND